MTAIKNASIDTLTVTEFHKAVFAACNTLQKAGDTAHVRMTKLLTDKYGAICPTYLQYKADQAALSQLAKDRGAASNQWVRKPYAAAVKSLYGELPASQDAAALAKRKERAQKAGNAPTAASVGAPKGERQGKPTSPSESIEQAITRMGLFKVLEACTKIMQAEESTRAQGKGIVAILKAA